MEKAGTLGGVSKSSVFAGEMTISMMPGSDAVLLNLAFLIDNVLAYDGVVFFYFHFIRGVPFVFCGGVKMSGVFRLFFVVV
jgi:hypothetical protein